MSTRIRTLDRSRILNTQRRIVLIAMLATLLASVALWPASSHAAGVVAFTKSYTPSAIELSPAGAPGQTSLVKYTITNASGAKLTNLTFADNVSGNNAYHFIPNTVVSTCGGNAYIFNFSLPNYGNTMILGGGVLENNDSCTITAQVVGWTPGTYVDPVDEALTAYRGTKVADSTTATLTVLKSSAVPSFSKTFTPNTFEFSDYVTTVEETSVVKYTIANNAPFALTGLSFEDTSDDVSAPAYFFIPGSVANSCGGTVAFGANNASIALYTGTLGVGASCEISVQIVGTYDGFLAGTFVDSTSQLKSAQTQNAAPASATLTIAEDNDAAPGFTKTFTPSTITVSIGRAQQTSTVEYTVTNPHPYSLTGVAFYDEVAGYTFLSGTIVNSCNGNSYIDNNNKTIHLGFGVVGPFGTCKVTAKVAGWTVGVWSAPTTSFLYVNEAQLAPQAQATLTVVAP